MPKKPNRTDLQNYVPAGNGDESGEYREGTSTSEEIDKEADKIIENTPDNVFY